MDDALAQPGGSAGRAVAAINKVAKLTREWRGQLTRAADQQRQYKSTERQVAMCMQPCLSSRLVGIQYAWICTSCRVVGAMIPSSLAASHLVDLWWHVRADNGVDQHCQSGGARWLWRWHGRWRRRRQRIRPDGPGPHWRRRRRSASERRQAATAAHSHTASRHLSGRWVCAVERQRQSLRASGLPIGSPGGYSVCRVPEVCAHVQHRAAAAAAAAAAAGAA